MSRETNLVEFHPAMKRVTGLLALLGELAVEQAALAARRRGDRRRVRKGATTRPGDDTPFWNALVEHLRPQLRLRGEKANLARVLGVPRQRVHEYFVARSVMPDAERVLHLIAWLTARTTPGALNALPKPVR